MAITDYSTLQAAVAAWLARDDLAANIPDFITLFEACANRRLRVRQMEATAMLAPSSGAAALPADYLMWRRLTWTGQPRVELEFVHPSILQAYYPSVPAGVPKLFTIEGATLKLRPTDDSPLEFDYFQKIPGLSPGNPGNWLLAAHPDLYLFGALVEAQGFNIDGEKLAGWKARRDELFEEIAALGRRTAAPSAIRVMGLTP
jgi:hypothetical protein